MKLNIAALAALFSVVTCEKTDKPRRIRTNADGATVGSIDYVRSDQTSPFTIEHPHHSPVVVTDKGFLPSAFSERIHPTSHSVAVESTKESIANSTDWDEAATWKMIHDIIPPYVTEGSWQPWEITDPCPVGFTCTMMGNNSLGAFSCDEMARIAVDEFGFGNVLAGTYCPEGEMGVLNCDVGGYCPDSKTRNVCPEGRFCPHKTYAPTLKGGSTTCHRCPAGADHKRFSKTQIILQAVLLTILCVIVIIKIVKRKVGINQEKMMEKLSLRSLHNHRIFSKTEAKREQEKFTRLRGKLEVIATRLDKIRQDEGGGGSRGKRHSFLDEQRTILYINKSGDIVFDANDFYDVLDTDNDGVLSFSEINEVLCLSDEQLRVFITNMKDQMPADYSSAEDDNNVVARSVFVKNFLDVLADASQLEPTAEEAGDLFIRISEEVGTTDSGEVLLENLYSSSLSSFLSDLQIYGIINRFKQTEGNQEGISKDDFVKFYPVFLSEVCCPDFASSMMKSVGNQDGNSEIADGLDVAFKDLCLSVTVGGKQVNVVDSVTGRLRSNTMTAVMGGSGSGKSSLLNALCGRAFYGTVTGDVILNGNVSSIEDHKAVIGFVPQDDIVYPDLTVRENLLYSGRLNLPAGTPEDEISELATLTMVSLGLSRIANSLVGDATRRGISGGEKKRVNIGLELMKRPKILFLDEPTSGLDSRSAFVVMDSLKRLVSTQGMTVASVIHQPRTDIYDMFDSLFLLGVGGRTVYHGPATEARSYFENLGFQMQSGESQADWFLDISSGDIELADIEARGAHDEHETTPKTRFEAAVLNTNSNGIGFVLGQPDGVERGQFEVREVGNIRYAANPAENTIQVGDKVVGINGQGVGQMTSEDVNVLLSKFTEDPTAEDSVFLELIREYGEESAAEAGDYHNPHGVKAPLVPSNKPAGKEDGALVKARAARETLYRHFLVHFENLPAPRRAKIYDPPNAFALPVTPKAVSFGSQFTVQLRRNCLLSWRNRNDKVIDFGILIIAILAMTLLGGANTSSWNSNPTQLPWIQFIASEEEASAMLPLVFSYAIKGVNAVISYGMMVGLIVSVLIGLNSTKVITQKRLEFFREAQGGINVTAFYIAATVTATIEQGLSALLGSILAWLIVTPSSGIGLWLWNFFMLSWLTVSWSILLAIVVPLNSVSTVVGFFNASFGLLFCGRISPGTFKDIYTNPPLAVFSGFLSPLRFFVEGLAVSEAMCLPNQSGYTVGSNAFSYPEFEESYPYSQDTTFMARTDLDTAIVQSCAGWFWWVPAALAVGITIRIAGGVAIHFSGRSKQGKVSFRKSIIDDFNKCRAGMKPIFQSFILNGIIVSLLFAGFFALSCWLILRENPEHKN